jgi:hypothetical protein
MAAGVDADLAVRVTDVLRVVEVPRREQGSVPVVAMGLRRTFGLQIPGSGLVTYYARTLVVKAC